MYVMIKMIKRYVYCEQRNKLLLLLLLLLRINDDLLVQVIEEQDASPAALPVRTIVPPRSLVLLVVGVTLPAYKNKTHFNFTPYKQ